MSDDRSGVEAGVDARVAVPPSLEVLGAIVELASHSEIHRHWTVDGMMRVFMPPMMLRQMCLWTSAKREPIAVLTWAWLSPEVERDFLEGRRLLEHEDWQSGDILYGMDWISPIVPTAVLRRDVQRLIGPREMRWKRIGRGGEGHVHKLMGKAA